MKANHCFLLGMLLGVWGAHAMEPFTNQVPVKEAGVFLTVAEEEEFPNVPQNRSDRPLKGNAMLWYKVKNNGTNRAFVHRLRGNRSQFDFELYDVASNRVQKTALGMSNTFRPSQITDFYSIRPELVPHGLQPGEAYMDQLFRVEDVFSVTNRGTYTLELRFWTWINKSNRLAPSIPIRLEVIKE